VKIKRNEHGLTKRQALFVAYGGMDCPRTAAMRANASRATRVRANLATLSEETREQLRLVKDFL